MDWLALIRLICSNAAALRTLVLGMVCQARCWPDIQLLLQLLCEPADASSLLRLQPALWHAVSSIKIYCMRQTRRRVVLSGTPSTAPGGPGEINGIRYVASHLLIFQLPMGTGAA